MRMSFFWSITLVLLLNNLEAAVVLKGDADAADNQTFSFDLAHQDQTRVFSSDSPLQSGDKFGLHTYVAAAPSAMGSSGEYAIARIKRDATQFIPVAPEKINFNPSRKQQEVDGQTQVVSERNDITNPFFNNGVSFFSWFNGAGDPLGGSVEKLVMVAQNDLKSIYFLHTFSETNSDNNVLLSVHNLTLAAPELQNIPDASGAVTSGIVGLAAEKPNVFAAVKPTAGGSSFGDVGSGVAVAKSGFIEGLFNGPVVADAPTMNPLRAGGNRAAALDVTSDFLKIDSDLASIGQVVDMHWFPEMQRLYVALQVEGGAAGTDGARALAVGRIVSQFVSTTNESGQTVSEIRDTAFVLEQIVPSAVFDGAQDKVIGAVGAAAQISIHKIRSMFASPAIPYLIGVGGVGAPADTNRSVFALPLVISNSDKSKVGTIAKKDAPVKEFFGNTSGTDISIFMARGVEQQAEVAADMPLATDAAVQVGGGEIVNGDIVDLYVYQDTVWVAVQDGTANELPGIFYSHALFDSNGKIKGWTIWRRAAGTTNKVFSAQFDPFTANKTFISVDSSGNVRTVKRTEWGSGEGLAPIVQATNDQFVQEQGGVQGLFDFGVTSTVLAIETPGLNSISMLVATGLGKVLLFETSRVELGTVIPTSASDFGVVELFDDGTITKTFPTGNKMISIQGGALDSIGPINAAEIARDGAMGANGWLFVGGVGGVAVLSQANGDGWDASTKLAAGFDGLLDGMAFKLFGDYNLVRKIINDGQYLYVLTNTQLDRIDLAAGIPGLGTITPVTIARADDVVGAGGSFLDAVISQKFALLATSGGLLRIGDGYNVQTSSNPVWQEVDTPEAIGPVRQLIAQSNTGRAQDVSASDAGGTVYALSAFRGKCQSQIFRYDVQQTRTMPVSASSIKKISDLFIENIPSYFASFGIFRNILATDGAIFMGSISKQLENDPLITALASATTPGIYSRFESRPLFNVGIKSGVEQSTIVSALLKNSSSGSWLAGTDGGMHINE